MAVIEYSIVFALGFILGAGAMLLYFQYSMYRQVGQFEDQMQKLMDMDDMEDMMGGVPEDLDESETEEEK